MANNIKKRRQSETSKILSGLQKANEQIVVSTNQAVNDILNNDFAQVKALSDARKLNQDRINKLNNDYVRLTQDVLNDQALQFLIEHSKINAPTLTSIQAGFELAKASRADKLNESRQLQVDSIQALNNINQDRSRSISEQNQQRLDIVRDNADRDVRANTTAADALIRATQGDITASERAAELATDRAESRLARQENAELERDLQNIRSRTNDRTAEQKRLDLFRSLQGGTAQQSNQSPGGSVSGSGTSNPLQTTPAPTAPAPIPQSSVGVTQGQSQPLSSQADPGDLQAELTDSEVLLLNFDRRKLSQDEPDNIFTAPLTVDNTTSNLSDGERLFLRQVRDQGGAEVVIQTLNEQQGFNIGLEEQLLTPSEREIINLNRILNNDDNLGDAPLVNEFGDLTSEEVSLVENFRERNLVPDELGNDEFDALVEFRTNRDGEVIPIGNLFNDLSEEDRSFITQRRLEQLDIPELSPPPRTESVVNSDTADDALLLTDEVVSQIDLLNQQEDRETVNPLTIQQQLIDDGVDVTELTVEQFNRLVEERGL